MPDAKKMLDVVQATDECLIAPPHQIGMSSRQAFSSLAQKGGSHWGPSLYCISGMVTLLLQLVSMPYGMLFAMGCKGAILMFMNYAIVT